MMSTTNLLIARAGAAAIAAAVALSPTYAAAPKPIIDLSQSPAATGKKTTTKPAAPGKPMIGPVDERTAEIGGGAIALIALGAGAAALLRRRRRADDEWSDESTAIEAHDPLFDEPIFRHDPEPAEPASAFAWGPNSGAARSGDRRRGESWVERAYRGPTPDNPSQSLRKRLKRAAFFDKRERETAAGKASPVEADAGLPDAVSHERQLEAA